MKPGDPVWVYGNHNIRDAPNRCMDNMQSGRKMVNNHSHGIRNMENGYNVLRKRVNILNRKMISMENKTDCAIPMKNRNDNY